ncbi:MAG: type I 3-dehydroquinate dehydratase [Prevotellaceae bacterium]|jgi:3-dehydroquinate dehydratase-1|nr:type I 3-dehydroquinate dehydratase [Prevotellaceae bacterium]
MFCVSIPSLPLPRVRDIAARADMAEIRLDLLRPATDELPALFSTCGRKTIATCRAGYYDDPARAGMLKAAINAGCGYVDLELDAPCAFLDTLIPYAKAKGCKVILSYHNFEATPEAEALELIIIEALACGADVVKIAAMVHTPSDAARLLALYARHTGLVAFGMGEMGKFTRVAALKLGAPFAYVFPDDASPTAPGQYSESEMRALWQRL